jgi:TatD DNase family protein
LTTVQITYSDTHCHLDFQAFDSDRETVIKRAREAGLDRILNPGIDLETSRAAIRLAEEYPEVYVSVGIHPNSALLWNSTSFRELEELSHHPKVVAIGEIGLDYYRHGAPVEVQRNVFQAQLELATERELPVIVHNREASGDVQEILTAWIHLLASSRSGILERPGVLHSYSGTWDMAQWAVEANLAIGITGPVTYRNASQLQQIALEIPLDRILIETDAPFLPPHPHRGERNEPAHVGLIAGKIAELRTIEKSEVAKSTSINAARLFRWRKID